MCLVTSPELLPSIFAAYQAVLSHYGAAVASLIDSDEGTLNDKQMLCQIAACVYCEETVFPKLLGQMEKRLCCSLSEGPRLLRSAGDTATLVASAFAKRRGRALVAEVLEWPTASYAPARGSRKPVTEPSHRFVRLFRYLLDLTAQAAECVQKKWARRIACQVLSETVCAMTSADVNTAFWAVNNTLSEDSLHQLVLDMKFVQARAGSHGLSDTASSTLTGIVQAAAQQHVRVLRNAGAPDAPSSAQSVLHPDEWYQQLIQRFEAGSGGTPAKHATGGGSGNRPKAQ
eukprot:TRINITY_DN4853_c0_g1_i2.p1 TRINITY_DN4853_c0_g1~~TRINITY_DN4853_c0_g1_i2.p1  ORF type:complete len:287 (+),score=66.10 TRINITY_DN4853_c0_g1_i2:161-1021(+)